MMHKVKFVPRQTCSSQITSASCLNHKVFQHVDRSKILIYSTTLSSNNSLSWFQLKNLSTAVEVLNQPTNMTNAASSSTDKPESLESSYSAWKAKSKKVVYFR